MDVLLLTWQLVGGVIGVWAGRQTMVIIIKQRSLSISSGLDWPWQWVDSTVFRWWMAGLSLIVFVGILLFSFESTLIGYFVGIPVGYFLRNVWKIDTSPPKLINEEDQYKGD